jgi:hypothetical protein
LLIREEAMHNALFNSLSNGRVLYSKN